MLYKEAVDIGVLLVQHGAAIEVEDLKPLECADKPGTYPPAHDECENRYAFWTSVARRVAEAKVWMLLQNCGVPRRL